MTQKFFSDLFGATEGEASNREDQYNKQRDEDIGMYQKVLYAPPGTVSPEQRSRAAQQIGKLRNLKKGDNPYEKVGDFLNTVGKHIQDRQQSTQAAPTHTADVTGGGATRSTDLPPIAAEGPKASLGKRLLGGVTRGLGDAVRVTGAALGSDVGSPQVRDLPPIDPKAFTPPDSYGKYVKVATRTDENNHQIVTYRNPLTGDTYQENEGSTRDTSKPYSQGDVSVLDARDLSNQGTAFIGEDNKPIDLSKLPDQGGLRRITKNGKTYYQFISPNERVVSVGGESTAVNPQNLSRLPSGSGTDLGTTHGGTDTETVNHLYGKETKRTPIVTGIKKAPGAPGAGAPGASTGASTSTGRSFQGPSGTTGAQPPPRAGKSSSPGTPGKNLSGIGGNGGAGGAGIGPRIANPTYQKQANAINEARASLIGDSETPGEVGGIASDLNVFRDPGSVKRLSEYIGFINQSLESDAPSVSSKGFWAAADWYSGLPRTVSNLQQEAYRKVGKPLSPDEQKFIADYYRLMGTIGGMRAATGASAAKWSFKNLQSELMTPGPVTSYGDAFNRLRNLTRETNVVAQNNPMVKPYDIKQLEKMSGGGDSGSGGVIKFNWRNGKIVKDLPQPQSQPQQ